jgi:hypothetical protein
MTWSEQEAKNDALLHLRSRIEDGTLMIILSLFIEAIILVPSLYPTTVGK